jgi:hypothetical protein
LAFNSTVDPVLMGRLRNWLSDDALNALESVGEVQKVLSDVSELQKLELVSNLLIMLPLDDIVC